MPGLTALLPFTGTPESEAEAKATKQVFALAVNGTESDVFDELLSQGSLWHCLRVGAWVQRFINNTRNSEHKRKTGAILPEASLGEENSAET